MATVTILEFDDFGNLISETESEIHTFESAAEMSAYLDSAISDYDEANGITDSDFEPTTGAEFQRLFDAHVCADSYHGAGAGD